MTTNPATFMSVARYHPRMFRLDEPTQMVATVVRQWCQAHLAPRIPALEAGTEQPFDLMKKMAKQLAFDAMLGASVQKRIAKLRAGDTEGGDRTLSAGTGNPMMMH